ncbi:MAG TPA: ABC transporter permease subunit [Gaiellaceae bacterium]|nr:ABC transporter permease subunit [Gaiellaceae bacterium]
MSAVNPGMDPIGEGSLARELVGGPAPSTVVARRRRQRPRIWRVVIFVLAAIFFIVPLVAAFKYSLLEDSGSYGFANYGEIINNKDVRSPLLRSLEIAVISAVIVIGLVLPTVVWVRLKKPQATAVLELVTLLPIVIPPVVMAAGLEELELNSPPWLINLVFNQAQTGLIPFYVVLAMPFTYRAIDTGLRAIDLHTLVDASRNLGASWPATLARVVLPNVQTAVLGALFLTVALCLGEVVIATLLLYNTFPVEMINLSKQSQVGVSVALSMITLVFTFVLLFLLSFLAQRRRGDVATGVLA